uniref:NADH-ubiquinone oxidoreductase chain 1 n=1 Tax=Proales similis TaxID=360698 RepID=A0A7D4X4W4_9BILA|nr:NADH dehydrogenase subunit 1 [Proales similis]
MIFLSWLIHCLLILLSVAFFTLFERKCMGLFQCRLGPNKVSLSGLLQPLLDAFKLLTKQNMVPLQANKFVYHVAPHMALILALFVWMTMPGSYLMLSMNYSLLIFFCVSSIMVFAVLLSGWASNSKYSLIGSLRSVAQSISYESVFSTLTVMMVFLLVSYSIRSSVSQSSVLFIFILPLWFICSLAETYRAPFDFSESESELVSGFNTEYSGAYFAFIFLSEYAMILYSCMLISYLFLSFLGLSGVLIYVIFSLLVSFLFIWVRITFCRFRYDMLMMTSWKTLLPLTLSLFVIYVCVMIIT